MLLLQAKNREEGDSNNKMCNCSQQGLVNQLKVAPPQQIRIYINLTMLTLITIQFLIMVNIGVVRVQN